MKGCSTAPASRAGMPAETKAKAPVPAGAVDGLPTLAALRRKLLLPYQAAWVEDDARFLCGVWARQTGKSFSTAAIIAASLAATPQTCWMIAAPSERQSCESLAKVKEWVRALGFFYSDTVDALQDVTEKAHGIELANGSRCMAVPGKPDTVRGMSANIWLDEFAFFEQPDETWRAILPSITNPLRGGQKRAVITSTPHGRSGAGKRFYDMVQSGLAGGRVHGAAEAARSDSAGAATPHPAAVGSSGRATTPAAGVKKSPCYGGWSVHRVTLPDAIAAGLPVNYEELAAAMDDPLAVAQELNCEFLDDSQTLLPYDIIALAESFSASEVAEDSLWLGGHDLRLGIDFGRSQDPTVCWTLERVGDVFWTREVLVLRGLAAPQQEEILRRRIRAASRVCFDYTGPGIGLGDYLAREFGQWHPEKHEFGKLELCTFTTKFKRDLFPRLRRAFEAPVRLRIPVSDAIRDDLHAMEQMVRNGEYSYAAPRTAEGHSDRCTALALAVRAAADAPADGLPIPVRRPDVRQYDAPREILHRPF